MKIVIPAIGIFNISKRIGLTLNGMQALRKSRIVASFKGKKGILKEHSVDIPFSAGIDWNKRVAVVITLERKQVV